MIKTRIRKCIAVFLSFSITMGMLLGSSFVLKASAASGVWTSATTLPPETLYDVAYGDGCFIAVSADGGHVYKSTDDGKNWQLVFTVADAKYAYITYGKGMFIATDCSTNKIYYSTNDGVSWTTEVLNCCSSYLLGITYGDEGFVALSSDGSYATIIYSNDGVNWKSCYNGTDPNGLLLQNVAFLNGEYVAVGTNGNVFTSSDGQNWTNHKVSTSYRLMDVLYSNGAFYTCDTNGSIFKSSDENSWSTVASTGVSFEEMASGGGYLYAVGDGGAIYKSTDGTNWSEDTSNTSSSLYGVCYGDDTFVAVGDGGTVVTSYQPEPYFIGVSALTVDDNSAATDIKSLLHVHYPDSGKTLTWSQKTAPTHGSLIITGATASSGSADITPGGTITYQPTAGYSGSDSFTIQASDGFATTTHTINVTVNDKTPPTGKITVGADQWSTLLSSFTFNRFFKGSISVAISASDAQGSGVKSVQYYQSPDALTLSDLQALTGWNAYSSALTITPTDAQKLIIYAKITDNAGNVTFISSDGMVFDTQGPVISTNYTKGATSMDVTVTDGGSGIQSVSYAVNGGSSIAATLDGSGKFTISSLPEGKYDVVIDATDKAGNTSSYTVNTVSVYTVKFKLYSGDTGADLKTQQVDYGNPATAPSDPTRSGYAFKGWDKSFSNITSDTTVNATWNIAGVTVTPYSGGYDAGAHDAVTVTGTLAGDTVTYSTNGTTYTSTCPQYMNVGNYPVYVKVSRIGCTDWTSGLATASISQAAGSITITGDPSKTYDGSAVADPAVTKNGSGEVSYTYYTDNSGSEGTALGGAPSNAGIYWVKASMAQDMNYTAAETTKKFIISGINMTGSVSITGSVLTGATVTANTSGISPAGATYSYVWKLDGTPISGVAGSSYVIAASDYGKTLTVSLVAAGNYSGTLTSSGAAVSEDIAPTGSITVSTNNWTSFLNTVTFGLFFKDTQNVTITASDAGGSGLKSMQYYKSASALSLADVQALTGWNDYTAAFSLTPTDAEKFVIYAKITDNAGNVSYLSSNGMVFDTQAPVISTNYTEGASSMDVTVTDTGSGVQSVSYTVNGGSAQTATLDANGKFTISSLPEGKYYAVISAIDNLGNTSSLTVHVTSVYTVTFKLFSGDIGAALKTQTVEYGSPATAPSTPTRTGFVFVGWDTGYDSITSNKTVNAAWNIGGFTITPYSGTYDGTAKSSVTVAGTLPGDTVTYSTNGTDYMASCPQYTDAGSYPIYVSVARAGYTTWESGLKTAVLNKKAITADMISGISSAEFTGMPITPLPVVTYGTATLKKDSDYTVGYSNNTDIGLASVNITGNGNYTGVASKNFGIYEKNTGVQTTGQQTPQVQVDGLQTLYQDNSIYTPQDKQIEQTGGSVKIELSVETLNNPSTNAEKIEKIAEGKTIGLYLDLSLSKIITMSGATDSTRSAISHTDNLLTVEIPTPDEFKGKSGLTIFRVHNDVASVIPNGKNNAVDGEYCTIDDNTITLYLKNFSTYAIGYTPSSNKAPSNPGTGDYPYTIPLAGVPVALTAFTLLVVARKKKHS